jgi:hypothetical protein
MLMIPRHPGAGVRDPPPAGSCPLITSETAYGAVIRAGSGEVDHQAGRLAVHDRVDYLCTTAQSLCAPWEMLGIALRADTHNRVFTCKIAIRALCINENPLFSTRHAETVNN